MAPSCSTTPSTNVFDTYVAKILFPMLHTWGEDAGFARELLEEALGHQIGTVVERAYRRTDSFDRRRAVMQAWADFCFANSPAP